VPYVVAWATSAHDEAARVFSKAFFEALAAAPGRRRSRGLAAWYARAKQWASGSATRDAYERAYEEAVDAIAFEMRLGTLASGVRSHVPRFALRDPRDAADAADCSPPPAASGLPLFLSDATERRGSAPPARPAVDAYAGASAGLWRALGLGGGGGDALPGPGPRPAAAS
jgi:hypothetical protein